MARPSRPRPVRSRAGHSVASVRAALSRAAASARWARLCVPVTWQQQDLLLDFRPSGHRTPHRAVLVVLARAAGHCSVHLVLAVGRRPRNGAAGRLRLRGRARVVFHDRARVEVVRHPAGTVDWDQLLERDRLRGFDLRRPGPLRLTLVDEPACAAEPPSGPGGPMAATRVLLTFHHGLLDAWSVFVLLEEFCRAYLADGVLPGGERRPDIRDWARWLAGQDLAPARDFWTRAVPGDAPRCCPAGPDPTPGRAAAGVPRCG
ncbi:hypothetical protein NKH18_02035 [Streptomyces sp. M10(2022)]